MELFDANPVDGAVALLVVAVVAGGEYWYLDGSPALVVLTGVFYGATYSLLRSVGRTVRAVTTDLRNGPFGQSLVLVTLAAGYASVALFSGSIERRVTLLLFVVGAALLAAVVGMGATLEWVVDPDDRR